MAQRLGLRVSEAEGSVQIKRLLRLPLKVPEQASNWKLAMPAGRKQGWPGA